MEILEDSHSPYFIVQAFCIVQRLESPSRYFVHFPYYIIIMFATDFRCQLPHPQKGLVGCGCGCGVGALLLVQFNKLVNTLAAVRLILFSSYYQPSVL